jgi:hypothetical protein
MSTVTQKVMASVLVVYFARKATSRTALECYALFLCAFSMTLLVSLPNVFQNLLAVAQSGLPAVGLFVLSALSNTSHVVQLMVLVGVVASALIVLDALKALRESPRLA